MSVSVVIPALEESAAIAAAVRSAVHAGAHEVIVVDGGSQDDTVAQARSAGAVVISSPAGRARQQNDGAAAATGDVLLFLHADCQLPENGISAVEELLCRRTDLVAGWFRQEIQHPSRVFRWIEVGNQLRAQVIGWAYGDQAIFVRRDVFQQVGCFPDIPLMEDLYLMKRLRRAGGRACVPATLQVSARRWLQRGTVRQTLRNWAMLLAVHLGVSPGFLARFYPRTT